MVATLTGTIFQDVDFDNIFNVGAGDTPLAGVNLFLDRNGNGTFEPDVEQSAISSADGIYSFVDILAGDVVLVQLTPPAGLVPGNTPAFLPLVDGETVIFDVSNQIIAPSPIPVVDSITGFFFNDSNGNGIPEPGEPGVPQTDVFIDLDNDKVISDGEPVVTTDANGLFGFFDLTQTFPGATNFIIRADVLTSSLNSEEGPFYSTPIPVISNPNIEVISPVGFNPISTEVLRNSGVSVTIGGFVPTAEFPTPLLIDDTIVFNTLSILGFSQPNYRVNEDGTTDMEVMVTRTEASVGEVNVTVVPSPGTATPGLDYDPTPQLVTFASGDIEPKLVTIPIIDDTLIEPDETILLNLVNPIGDTILGLSTATLTINRSDTGVALNLSGIEDLEPVNTVDSLTNAGVEFSSNALGIVSFQQGGSGNFIDPLNKNAITYDQQDSIIINVPNGFDQQFSFRYASPFFFNHTVTIYDQVNGQGDDLANSGLPLTLDSELTPGAYQISAEPFSIPFEGIARSVVIGSEADKLVFNDLTFG